MIKCNQLDISTGTSQSRFQLNLVQIIEQKENEKRILTSKFPHFKCLKQVQKCVFCVGIEDAVKIKVVSPCFSSVQLFWWRKMGNSFYFSLCVCLLCWCAKERTIQSAWVSIPCTNWMIMVMINTTKHKKIWAHSKSIVLSMNCYFRLLFFFQFCFVRKIGFFGTAAVEKKETKEMKWRTK